MLTLTPGFEIYDIPGLTQHHIPMGDLPTRAEVKQAIDIIAAHLAQSDRVWVHCQKGLDRTGCVIGAYLVSSGIAPDRAVALLLERFPPVRRHPRMIQLWRPFEQLIRSF